MSSIVLVYTTTSVNTQISVQWGTATGTITVNWGDTTTSTFTFPYTSFNGSTGGGSRTYASIGTYTITITGAITQYGTGTQLFGYNLLKQITSWDNGVIVSFNSAFNGGNTTNLTSVPATLPPTLRTLNSIFYQCKGLNDPNISSWNTSNITDMGSMFRSASVFNQSLNSWNTSNVKGMASIFQDAAAFNSPIVSWDLSYISDTTDMFNTAVAFNKPLNLWNVSKVTTMVRMFQGATAFNQPLNTWNVSKVTNMGSIFDFASAFNQPLHGWDIINVTSFGFTRWAMSPNNWSITLIGWASQTVKSSVSINPGGVSTYYPGPATVAHSILTSAPYSWTISDASSAGTINNPYITLIYVVPANAQVALPLTTLSGTVTVDWGDTTSSTFTSSGITSPHTYTTAGTYMINISGTVTAYGANSGVTGITYLTRAIWLDNGSLTSLSNAFYGATNLTYVVNQTSATVKDLSYTFYGATKFYQSVGLWNISNVTTMVSMFTNSGISPGTGVSGYSGTLIGWGAQTVKPNIVLNVGTVKYLSTAVSARTTLTSTPNFWTITDGNAIASITLIYTIPSSQSIAAPYSASSGTLSFDWGDGNINAITPHTYAAAGTYTLKMYGSITQFGGNGGTPTGMVYLKSVTEWDNGTLTNLSYGLRGSSVTSVPTTLPPAVINVTSIFYGVGTFNSDISGWDVSRITDMTQMFNTASFNQPINNWNTISVTDMTNMFFGGSFNQSLNSWNVSNVTTMYNMFFNNSQFNGVISNWNTMNVTSMGNMFYGASSFNQSINVWNVSNVKDMSNMFSGGNPFNQDLSNWNVSNVTNISSFTNASKWSAKNYSNTLIGWAKLIVKSNVGFSNTTLSYYPSAVASRSILTSSPYTWTITGDSLLQAIQLIYNLPSAGLSIVLPLKTLSGTITVTWGDTSSSTFTVSGLTAPHTYSAAGSYTVTITGTVTTFGANTGVTGIQYLTDVNTFDNGSITSLANAFYGATSLTSVPTIIPTTLTNVSFMFYGATSFNQSLATWSVVNITTMASTFTNSGLSYLNYSAMLVAWSVQAVKSNVPLGAGSITYLNTASSAQSTLSSTYYSWTITDGGLLGFMTLVYTVPSGAQIPLPLRIFTGSVYVDWGDTTNNTFTTSGTTAPHTYSSAGTYTIVINGLVTSFGNDTPIGGTNYLTSVKSWDNGVITNLSNAFLGPYVPLTLTSVPSTLPPTVTNISNLFGYFGHSLNQDISGWNVSNITDMSSLFNSAGSFNKPLNTWNVSNVRSMGGMFGGCTAFNQPLNSWNVSKVTNMFGMFGSCTAFNQSLNTWNTINVVTMEQMFYFAPAFNQPLNNWNTSNVTNMRTMFQGASAFNQPIGLWNVSNVLTMTVMFNGASAFNQSLNTWNVSKVGDMSDMFNGASAFNQPLHGWNVSNVGGFGTASWGMSTNNWSITLLGWASQTVKSSVSISTTSKYYAGATVSRSVLTSTPNSWSITDGGLLAGSISNLYITLIYTVPTNAQISLPLTTISGTVTVDWGDSTLSAFTTSGVTSLHKYTTAGTYMINISGTVTAFGSTSGVSGMQYLTRAIWLNNGALTSLSNAFYRATNLTFVINQIPATITDLSYTFYGARYFNQSLSLWNISNVTTMASMFTNSGLGPYGYSGTLIGWATQTVKPNIILNVGTVKYLSTAVSARTTLTSTPNFWTITDGNAVASISLVYTVLANTSVAAPVITSSGTLSYDWGDGNINSITPHTYVSAGTYTLKMYGAISRFSLSSQPAGYQYLKSCLEWDNGYLTSLQQAFFCNTTGNVTSVPTTLPSTVTTINGIFTQCTSFNGNISGWDVSRVTDMAKTFIQCSIFNTSINTWDVSNVKTMDQMFDTSGYNQSLNYWNTINVTTMVNMFANSTTFNQSIGSWNVSNVNDMTGMFNNSPFNQSLNSWNTINVTNMNTMFYATSAFNQSLNAWNVSNVKTMNSMFKWNQVFNSNISSWNTSNVTSMAEMFSGEQAYSIYTIFNQRVGSWNVSNVTDMSYIFYSNSNFNQDLSNWDIGKVRYWQTLNYNISNNIWYGNNYSATLIAWAKLSVTPSISFNINNTQYYPSAVASRSILTSAPYNWTISGDTLVTAIQLVYKTPSAGVSIVLPLTTLTGTVTVTWGDNTSSTFTISGLTAPHTYSASGTYVVTITGTVTAFGANTGVTGIQYLTDVYSLENGAITSLANAFYGATSLTSVPVFLPTTVVQIPYMFYLASSFNQSISSWNVSNITNMTAMFENSGLSTANYSSILIGWAKQSVKSSVALGAGTITYYTQALSSRTILTSSPNNWTITDGGSISGTLTTQNYTISISRNSDGQTVFSGYFATLPSVAPNVITNFYDYSQPTGTNSYTDIYINDGLRGADSSFNTVSLLFSSGGTNINVTNNIFFRNLDGNNRVQFYSASPNSFYTFSSPSVTNVSNYSGQYAITINALASQTSQITCFKRGTKILCFIDNQEKYVPIEDIRNGMLVKTFQNGYVKIDQIGRSDIMNPGTNDRIKDRLYKLTKQEFPELIEDLYLTGAHCLLVEEIEREAYNKTIEIFGNLLITDGMIRLMAYLDYRCEPYNDETIFDIWHFALEHDDPYANYGVYANGLLVETVSKRWMREHSGMEIL